jgi:hypothetical protein
MIAYEPHPVTPERKAELRAQGLKIIDIRFAPPSEAIEQREAKPQRARKSKPEPDEAE